MIFQHTIEAVLSGKKTQTRRVVKAGQEATLWDSAIVLVTMGNGSAKYALGGEYAVQPGRGKKSVARIVVTAIRQEHVQDITEEDALAEGCDDLNYYESARDEYMVLWDSIQPSGRRWADNPEVWVIEFELVGKDGER